jgi:hypothetical protein
MKLPGNTVAQRANLDLNRYTPEQLQKLNKVGDDKIDADEAKAAVRVADVNQDGLVSKTELKGLDYLLGKDTSLAAAKAFAQLHERSSPLQSATSQEWHAANTKKREAEEAHTELTSDRLTALNNEARLLGDEGILVPSDSPARLREAIAALGDQTKLSPAGQKELHRLEMQLQYAELKETFDAFAAVSYAKQEQARADFRSVDVVTKSVAELMAQAKGKAPLAGAVLESETAAKVAIGMRAIRELTRKNPSPEMQRDTAQLLELRSIKEGVIYGSLDESAVDMKKLNADLDAAQAKVDLHTLKLESTARNTIKYMESPDFQKAMAALPEADRAQIEGTLHAMIADTKAGAEFFDRNLAPVLRGDANAKPYYVEMFRGGRHGSKMGMNALQLWGYQIAKRFDGDSAKALDRGLAMALGLPPGKVDKVILAIEVGNKKGIDAGKKILADDPELKRLAGQFEGIAKTVALASASIAAYDLYKNPDLRNAVAAAKGAGELADAIGRFAKADSTLGRYGRLAGRWAPGLDLLVGGMDAHAAAKRGDVGGTVGGGMQAVGGAIALGAAATGVGLPVAVIGGVIAVAGSLVGMIWGDSATEKWLKSNAPEYLK